MKINDVMLRVVDALDQAKVPYMLVGAFSSNYHGIPRSTQDVDLVIQLESPLAAEFGRLLGQEFEAEPQMTFETNTGTQRQEFRVRKTLFKVEVFRLSDDPFDRMRFQRRKVVAVASRSVWMPTPEDVIVMKLRWARGKDKEDVKDVMSVQRGRLDWDYIQNWCRQHGSLSLMEEIRKSVPPT